jgi:hypothetical protein
MNEMAAHHMERIDRHDASINDLRTAMAVMQEQMKTMVAAQRTTGEQVSACVSQISDLDKKFDKVFNRGWGMSFSIGLAFIIVTSGISGGLAYLGMKMTP